MSLKPKHQYQYGTGGGNELGMVVYWSWLERWWWWRVREEVRVEENRKNQIIETEKAVEHEKRTQIKELSIFLII